MKKRKNYLSGPCPAGHIEKSLNEFKLRHEKSSEIELPRLNTDYKNQWAADLNKTSDQENSTIEAGKTPELPEQGLSENLDKGMER